MEGEDEGQAGEVGELREVADLVHWFLSKNYYVLMERKNSKIGFDCQVISIAY